MAMKQEANTPLILTISAISGLLILVIYFGAEAWFRTEERIETTGQWERNPNVWLNDLRAGQQANLYNINAAITQVANSNGKLIGPSTQPAGGPSTGPTTRVADAK